MDLRVSAAAPLCGVLAVLAQGMTDYSWYNYRVYLMMWLVCGLASAYVRTGNEVLDRSTGLKEDDSNSVDMSYRQTEQLKKRKSKPMKQ